MSFSIVNFRLFKRHFQQCSTHMRGTEEPKSTDYVWVWKWACIALQVVKCPWKAEEKWKRCEGSNNESNLPFLYKVSCEWVSETNALERVEEKKNQIGLACQVWLFFLHFHSFLSSASASASVFAFIFISMFVFHAKSLMVM